MLASFGLTRPPLPVRPPTYHHNLFSSIANVPCELFADLHQTIRECTTAASPPLRRTPTGSRPRRVTPPAPLHNGNPSRRIWREHLAPWPVEQAARTSARACPPRRHRLHSSKRTTNSHPPIKISPPASPSTTTYTRASSPARANATAPRQPRHHTSPMPTKPKTAHSHKPPPPTSTPQRHRTPAAPMLPSSPSPTRTIIGTFATLVLLVGAAIGVRRLIVSRRDERMDRAGSRGDFLAGWRGRGVRARRGGRGGGGCEGGA